MQPHVNDTLRVWPWLLGALLATVVVAFIAPYQLGVLMWSLSKLALGAYLGYWIDRSIFHYARPHTLSIEIDGELVIAASLLRRALLVAAAILALGLGV